MLIYLFLLPSSLFPRACLLFTDCGKCVLSSHLLTLPCFQLRRSLSRPPQKAPGQCLTPKAGLHYSRSQQSPYEQDRGAEVALRCKRRKRKRVISRAHGHRRDKIEMRELFSLVSLRSHPSARQPIRSTRVNQHVRSEVKITPSLLKLSIVCFSKNRSSRARR